MGCGKANTMAVGLLKSASEAKEVVVKNVADYKSAMPMNELDETLLFWEKVLLETAKV